MTPRSKFSIFLDKMDWTTAALAEAMDRPINTVKSWRSGQRGKRLPKETREKLAGVLGISMRRLKQLLEG